MRIGERIFQPYNIFFALVFVLVSAISLVTVYSLRTDEALQQTEKDFRQSLEALGKTCEHFNQYQIDKNTNSLLNLRERAQMVSDFISNHDNDDLKRTDFLSINQYLSGVVLLAPDGLVEYSSTDDARAFWYKFSLNHHAVDLSKSRSHSFMEHTSMEGVEYNTLITNRRDKPGYIFIYTKEKSVGDLDFTLKDVLTGRKYPLDADFFIRDREGKIIYATNMRYEKLLDLMIQKEGTKYELTQIHSDEESWYGLCNGSQNYMLYFLVPAQKVFARRVTSMYICAGMLGVFAFLLLLLRIMFMGRSTYSVSRADQIAKAVTSGYETVLYFCAERNNWSIIRMSEEQVKKLPLRKSLRSVINTLIDIYVDPAKQEEANKYLEPEYLLRRINEKKFISCLVEDCNGIWHIIRVIPVDNKNKKNGNSFVLSVKNIDTEKRKETELLEQLKQSELQKTENEKTRNEFIRRLSFDLRNPINVLHGMVAMAQKNVADQDKVKDYMEKIALASDRLLNIFNQVLIMNKFENDSLSIEENIFDLRFLLEDVVDIVKPDAQKSDVELEYIPYSGHQIMVKGCQLYVRQVLLNLLENAVRYNRKKGKATLQCRESFASSRELWLEFVISDTGMGMSEEFQKHAFEPLAQENEVQKTSGVYGEGMGFGLAITKRLVEAMRGSLSFISTKNIGTVFTVRLPFGLVTEKASHPISFAGHKVLIVEDNELNLEVAEFILGECGVEVISAHNGQEAVDIFNTSKLDEISLIFMDIMMPIMDGLQASRKIRSLDRDDAKRIPIIAVTANTFDNDRSQSIEAGMNDHICKPLGKEKIEEILKEYISDKER